MSGVQQYIALCRCVDSGLGNRPFWDIQVERFGKTLCEDVRMPESG